MCVVILNNILLRSPSSFPAMFEYADQMYTAPWCRILTYQVGVIIGFALHRIRSLDATASAVVLAVIERYLMRPIVWTVIVAVLLVGIYDDETAFGPLQNQLTWSGGRFVLFLVIGSGILLAELEAMACPGGGLVNRIARHPFFERFSKVSYCFYMCHSLVLLGIVSTLEQSVSINNCIMVRNEFYSHILLYMDRYLYTAWPGPAHVRLVHRPH